MCMRSASRCDQQPLRQETPMNNLLIGMPGPGELAIILGVLVLLFGAKKIPELGRGLGSAFFEFKRGIQAGREAADEVERAREDLIRRDGGL